MRVIKNYSLKKLNTFGIHVNSEYFVEVYSDEELVELIQKKEINRKIKLILGGGSNILISKDIEGIVVKVSVGGIEKVEENESSSLIDAGSGVIWDDLVSYAVQNNLGGIENLRLIPGNVGAAPIQNIGAYGQELSDTFESLTGVFSQSGTKKTFRLDECKFGYRDSIFKRELKDKFIITSVRLRLNKNPEINCSYKQVETELKKLNIDKPTIQDISDLIAKIRRSKLPYPDEIGNAGSFFKNPVVNKVKFMDIQKLYSDIISYSLPDNLYKIAAGWLIEKCGWKGKRIGNVGTHTKHALIIVNYGGASGEEILDFSDKLVNAVEKKFGIKLENEVNVIN
jgi:UDP-N-acetylmuramate dehydrogenase